MGDTLMRILGSGAKSVVRKIWFWNCKNTRRTNAFALKNFTNKSSTMVSCHPLDGSHFLPVGSGGSSVFIAERVDHKESDRDHSAGVP